MSNEVPTLVRLPLRARVLVAAVGVAVIWGAVLVGAQLLPADLTVVLLLLLVVVLAIAAVTGPGLGIATAVVGVVLVNWYLVPPYGTFEIASTDNLVALVVFGLLAGLSSLLVDLTVRIQAGAQRSTARADLLGEVVSRDDDSGSTPPLERIRVALDLDRLSLLLDEAGTERVLRTTGSGPDVPTGDGRVVDVAVGGGYRLVGSGQERMAEDPEFLESLADAAVRSYESERMKSERLRAEELAAVDSARTALLASVGHDLRTPLAGLRLSVDALRQPGSHLDAEASAELLETIEGSARRLDELITNLLDMSRLEAGVLLSRPEPTAIDAVVAGAVLAWPSAAVMVDVDDALPLAWTDPALLERVLDNLVSNAIRYAAPEPGRPIRITAAATSDAVVIDVTDHGPGLAAPDGPPRAALSAGGPADRSSGLGLGIVRGFCAALHVDVEFLDTEGGGLTVRLTVPRATAVAS